MDRLLVELVGGGVIATIAAVLGGAIRWSSRSAGKARAGAAEGVASQARLLAAQSVGAEVASLAQLRVALGVDALQDRADRCDERAEKLSAELDSLRAELVLERRHSRLWQAYSAVLADLLRGQGITVPPAPPIE